MLSRPTLSQYQVIKYLTRFSEAACCQHRQVSGRVANWFHLKWSKKKTDRIRLNWHSTWSRSYCDICFRLDWMMMINQGEDGAIGWQCARTYLRKSEHEEEINFQLAKSRSVFFNFSFKLVILWKIISFFSLPLLSPIHGYVAPSSGILYTLCHRLVESHKKLIFEQNKINNKNNNNKKNSFEFWSIFYSHCSLHSIEELHQQQLNFW